MMNASALQSGSTTAKRGRRGEFDGACGNGRHADTGGAQGGREQSAGWVQPCSFDGLHILLRYL
jgi:hypothetical protein